MYTCFLYELTGSYRNSCTSYRNSIRFTSVYTQVLDAGIVIAYIWLYFQLSHKIKTQIGSPTILLYTYYNKNNNDILYIDIVFPKHILDHFK